MRSLLNERRKQLIIMNYRIGRLLYFSVYLVIFVTILGEAILTPLSTKTIAQVSQTNDTQPRPQSNNLG
ncbi:hypothetical protein STA3757_28890 [Stanieria sp. NIES-3757]|nr:hypothetical protein STA3757_28890 [Stanieria sp. NIES-3757]